MKKLWGGQLVEREENGQEKAKKQPFVALMVALGLLLFLGNAVGLLAQPAPQSTAAGDSGSSTSPENIVCQIEMGKFLEVESAKYRAFMEQHFQNKSSTSSLLDMALGRYQEFRTAAYREYARYVPHQGALQLTEGLESGACRRQMEDALFEARRVLEAKALATSSVKKTTALLQKYQSINGQLRGLNLTFLRMKAYLDAFSDKLPCYIQSMCNKQ